MSVDLENLIAGLETELLRPETRTSKQRLDELIADDFVELGQSGQRYHKADVLALLPRQPATRVRAADFELRRFAADAVLLTYRVERESAAGAASRRSWRSSIWRRCAGRWQIVFHQGTALHPD